MRATVLSACLGLAGLGAVSIARADTVTLLPIADATISEKTPASSLGAEITLDSGTTGPVEGALRNRALLKFDLAAIPGHARITSVGLVLTLVQAPAQRVDLWFNLHRVLQGWSEQAVTWTNRLSPPAPWNVAGGASPADYAASISQSNLIGERGPYTFTSSPGLVADVQDWVANPGANFGWILVCASEDLERSVRKFGSKEAATISTRPVLEVQFTLAAGPTLVVLPRTNDYFQFVFNAEPQKSYTVFSGADLATMDWQVLTKAGPWTDATNVLISDLIQGGTARYYRVRRD